MNTTYGIGGALQSIGGNIMQMAFGNMQDKKIEERKKQAEEAARILEESRVARTSRPYMKKGDPKAFSPWMSQESKGYATPTGTTDQLMVSEYNSQGRPIGQRFADPAEKQGYDQEQLAAAQTAAAAKSDAEAKMRKENRDEMKLRSQLARDKASTAASYANAESSRAYAKNLASPSVGNEATLWKDINNLLGDPDYQAAVQAGDPSVLREMGASDPVIGGLRAAGKAIGADVPEDSRPNLLREIEQEQDPAVRAQMLASFKRRLEMAAAKGRASGKGIRPPRVQE